MKIASVLSLLTIIVCGNAFAAAQFTIKDANGNLIGKAMDYSFGFKVPFMIDTRLIFLRVSKDGFADFYNFFYESPDCSGEPLGRFNNGTGSDYLYDEGIVTSPGRTLYGPGEPVPEGTQILSRSDISTPCEQFRPGDLTVSDTFPIYRLRQIVDLAVRYTPPFNLIADNNSILDLSKPQKQVK